VRMLRRCHEEIGRVGRVGRGCYTRMDPREDVARVGRVGEDITRMLHKKTAPMKFQLHGIRGFFSKTVQIYLGYSV